MATVVGISLCLDDRGSWRPGHDYQYIDARYAQAVEAAGGLPLHLPIQADVGAIVAKLDALLIPGGDDLMPDRAYPDAVQFNPVPQRQLAFDRALLTAALEGGLPVLGICYGMQLLAQHFGAELLYDIAQDRPESDEHQLGEPDGRHALEIRSGSILARTLGTESGNVNSLHHQAVASPGAELVASAYAPDGLIEAVEHPNHAFLLGVQWHPEKLPAQERAGLFEAFVNAAKPRGERS